MYDNGVIAVTHAVRNASPGEQHHQCEGGERQNNIVTVGGNGFAGTIKVVIRLNKG
jgi:hypothetical protein